MYVSMWSKFANSAHFVRIPMCAKSKVVVVHVVVHAFIMLLCMLSSMFIVYIRTLLHDNMNALMFINVVVHAFRRECNRRGKKQLQMYLCTRLYCVLYSNSAYNRVMLYLRRVMKYLQESSGCCIEGYCSTASI